MISAVILTKNEEKNIVDCIRSLEWCGEIVLIDDFSQDKTVEKVIALGNKKIKIFTHHLSRDFAAMRNYGIEKSSGNWIFFVDADERVTESLQYEIVSTLSATIENFSGFYIKRKDTIWGKILNHGESSNVKLLRLGRKGLGKWKGKVHEVWEVKGKIGQLNNPLVHFPHQDVATFLREINFYTDLRAQELYTQNERVHWWSVLLYPAAKFMQNYFLRLGILDGIRGLIFAILMSLHSFLVRGKLWVLWQDKST